MRNVVCVWFVLLATPILAQAQTGTLFSIANTEHNKAIADLLPVSKDTRATILGVGRLQNKYDAIKDQMTGADKDAFNAALATALAETSIAAGETLMARTKEQRAGRLIQIGDNGSLSQAISWSMQSQKHTAAASLRLQSQTLADAVAAMKIVLSNY